MRQVLNVRLVKKEERSIAVNFGKAGNQKENIKENRSPAPAPNKVLAKKKIGRNDPCPCGSGKKYKNCCGNKA